MFHIPTFVAELCADRWRIVAKTTGEVLGEGDCLADAIDAATETLLQREVKRRMYVTRLCRLAANPSVN